MVTPTQRERIAGPGTLLALEAVLASARAFVKAEEESGAYGVAVDTGERGYSSASAALLERDQTKALVDLQEALEDVDDHQRIVDDPTKWGEKVDGDKATLRLRTRHRYYAVYRAGTGFGWSIYDPSGQSLFYAGNTAEAQHDKAKVKRALLLLEEAWSAYRDGVRS